MTPEELYQWMKVNDYEIVKVQADYGDWWYKEIPEQEALDILKKMNS